MRLMKFVVEQHEDGYVAYPLGLRGAVVGQGETDVEALADAQSAARFHLETFGSDALADGEVQAAYVTEAEVA